MKKEDLRVGDIVLANHGRAYCVTCTDTFGSFDKNYISVLNEHGMTRSIHIDAINSVIEHTDYIDLILEQLKTKNS